MYEVFVKNLRCLREDEECRWGWEFLGRLGMDKIVVVNDGYFF